jgi:hypothetical protein
MNVAQVTQTSDAAPVNPLAEAVRGLARDRSRLIVEIEKANTYWVGYDKWLKEQYIRIAETDKRIDALLAISTTPPHRREKGNNEP